MTQPPAKHYPYNNKGNFGTNIVVRGINNEELDIVAEKLKSKLL